MCSVLGIVSDEPIPQKLLTNLNQAIKHRGPDSSGMYLNRNQRIGLGHNRLSIIDLSERGAQPMSKHNRVVVFNGEIFNYEAINKELESCGYSFTSHCDTETILSAYDKWGHDCFKRLNGFFAIIIYDLTTNEIIVARDRLGVKQLVYTKTPHGFVFASEIKALLRHPDVMSKPNLNTLRRDLIFHFWNEKTDTHFENIFHTKAGHYGIVANGKFVQKSYWTIDTALADRAVTTKATETLKALLIDATRIRMHADVPISVLLSGGLDSSLIAALAAATSTRVDCFSLDYGNDNEDLRRARELVALHPQLKHHLVSVRSNDFSDRMLRDASYHMEEPLLDQAYISVYRNYQSIAEQDIKVTLNGQGADEAWLGYYNFYEFLRFRPERLKLKAFTQYWLTHNKLAQNIPEKTRKALIAPVLAEGYLMDNKVIPAKSLFRLSIRNHLQNMLMQEDRMSMAHGVECRLPFVDYRVIELAARIPASIKVVDGQEKYILRQAARVFLPKSIWQREKAVFPMPPEAHTTSFTATASLALGKLAQEVLQSTSIDKTSMSSGDAWKIFAINMFEKVFFV